ncbi:hypothetical protein CC86DRAFT_69343 [Ophiobolus disseminans]|uniref:Uncharacterized protein n=1 Tax=Ophiobolus disseminans TaxID=1469910 RepID=A0A6A6ZSF6_9PLEO|nr:hypothetical protein CC86DRAFT_69343 [Ophiobolus disseminans]
MTMFCSSPSGEVSLWCCIWSAIGLGAESLSGPKENPGPLFWNASHLPSAHPCFSRSIGEPLYFSCAPLLFCAPPRRPPRQWSKLDFSTVSHRSHHILDRMDVRVVAAKPRKVISNKCGKERPRDPAPLPVSCI